MSEQFMKEMQGKLHLYNGCDLILNHDKPKERTVRSFFGWTDHMKLSVRILDRTGREGRCSIAFVKPRLRLIQDITEQEALELGKLLKHIPSNYAVNMKYIRVLRNKNGFWDVRWGNTPGEFWSTEIFPIYTQWQSTYLYQIGVDVFEWIKDGYAINAKDEMSFVDQPKDF